MWMAWRQITGSIMLAMTRGPPEYDDKRVRDHGSRTPRLLTTQRCPISARSSLSVSQTERLTVGFALRTSWESGLSTVAGACRVS